MKKFSERFNGPKMVRRHIIIMALAFFFGGMNDHINWLIDHSYSFNKDYLPHILFNFFYISLIWNGNELLMSVVDRYLDWHSHTRAKIVVSAAIALVLPVLIHFSFNLGLHPVFFGRPCDLGAKENYMSLIIAIVVTLLVNCIYVASEFFEYWKKSLTEKEEFKRTSITAEFETLKNQVNPHFLFNSLNTLTSLIEEDTKKATDFVEQLAHVYRYVLLNRDNETVSLKEELEFTRSFIYLNQMRFGDNLQSDIRVPEAYQSLHLPTLSLQMLVENAVKHNIISKDKPLKVTVQMNEASQLCISNNLQRKPSPVAGSKIGLTNIMSRYGFYTDEEVVVTDDGKTFCVCLPLLDSKKII